MLTKKQIIEAIEAMPEDNFDDIDILLERLVILEKIERGLQDVKKGNVLSEEEAEKEIDSWFR